MKLEISAIGTVVCPKCSGSETNVNGPPYYCLSCGHNFDADGNPTPIIKAISETKEP